MKIIVLGGGRVGSAMAEDLARDPGTSVTVADISERSLSQLHEGIATVQADLSDAGAVRDVVATHDLVVGAVPGWMGFETMRAVLEAGKNIVDISFFDEDPFELDALAREQGLTAVMDCGVAPGAWNMIVARQLALFDEVESCLCYVGGLPVVRTWPYEYKAVFSPSDVIEEYTRPARYVVDRAVVTRPALSEPQLLDFPGVGTLEAFNTDGLRTMIRTCAEIPNMKEMTLRYPGHIEKMRMLRETGFFSKEELEVGGVKVRPLDFTSKLLFPAWQLGEGEADLTVMQVIVEGRNAGERVRHTYDLLDHYDEPTKTTSMARTTGYTCTATVRAVAAGAFSRKGLCPPEYLGQAPESYEFVMAELAKRNVRFSMRVEDLPS